MNANYFTNNRLVLPWLGLLLCQAALLAQPAVGTPLWTYDAGVTIYSSPALAADGTVYFAAGTSLFAITNGGSNKWTFALGGSSSGSPAVGGDGTVYLANNSGFIYAVNPNGTQKWAETTGGGTASPAIAHNNVIYTHGYLFLDAVSSSGGLIWQHRIGGDFQFGSPSIGQDGTIYAPSPQASKIYALDPDGTERWAAGFFPGSGPAESIAIGRDGTVYVPADGLYAYSPSGTNLWVCQLNQFMGSTPVIGQDGTIYLTTQAYDPPYLAYGARLHAISTAGMIKWQFDVPACCHSAKPNTPAVDAAGNILFTAFDRLFAIGRDGNLRWKFSTQASPGDESAYSYTSPSIGPDGTVFTTFGSKLYAIAGTNALGNTPWPMYRQNPKHTGKTEKPSLQKPQKRSDANFEFQLYAQLGQTNIIETTTNLNTWTSLTSVVVTTVPQPVVDLTASNHPSRLYRTFSP